MYEQSSIENYDWLHFATRSGEQGRDWANSYRRQRTLVRQSQDALEHLRKGRLTEGRDYLEQMARGLQAIDRTGDELPASIRCVLERWYQGVLGYYYYCSGDQNEAARAMMRANEAVSGAITHHWFLVLLANHCHEFCLHQARIARNSRNWTEMFSLIDQARGMLNDAVPLCVLESGEIVRMSDLRHFLESLGELSDAERQATMIFFDRKYRATQFERFVRRLCIQPGFAISWN